MSSLLRPLSETNRRGLAAAPGRDDAPAPHAPSTAAHSLSGGNSRVRTVHCSAVIIHHARRKCKHSAQIISAPAHSFRIISSPTAAAVLAFLRLAQHRLGDDCPVLVVGHAVPAVRGRSARAPSPGAVKLAADGGRQVILRLHRVVLHRLVQEGHEALRQLHPENPA